MPILTRARTFSYFHLTFRLLLLPRGQTLLSVAAPSTEPAVPCPSVVILKATLIPHGLLSKCNNICHRPWRPYEGMTAITRISREEEEERCWRRCRCRFGFRHGPKQWTFHILKVERERDGNFLSPPPLRFASHTPNGEHVRPELMPIAR